MPGQYTARCGHQSIGLNAPIARSKNHAPWRIARYSRASFSPFCEGTSSDAMPDAVSPPPTITIDLSIAARFSIPTMCSYDLKEDEWNAKPVYEANGSS